MCCWWDSNSQPSGYLKLPGSPGTTQLHWFRPVRAPQMPCMPLPLCLPLSVSLALYLLMHAMHTHFSLMCLFASLCTPVECPVSGHKWGNLDVYDHGQSLTPSGCLFSPFWAPPHHIACTCSHLQCHACPANVLCQTCVHTCKHAHHAHGCQKTYKQRHGARRYVQLHWNWGQLRSNKCAWVFPRGIPSSLGGIHSYWQPWWIWSSWKRGCTWSRKLQEDW